MKRRSASKPRSRRLARLESLRGVAAFYVFCHHFAHTLLAPKYPRIASLFIFGQTAVILFFILSGFVIFYSTNTLDRDITFRQYFKKRFRRIYPLFLIALMLSYTVASIDKGGFAPVEVKQLFGNLAMLQDQMHPGTWFAPYYRDAPLWSLSYEWFFYMAFFPLSRLMRDRVSSQKYAVFGLSVLGFATYKIWPNQISYFLMYFVIWWAGVELARQYLVSGTITFRGQRESMLSLGVMVVAWTVTAWHVLLHGPYVLDLHPLLELRHFASAWLMVVFGIFWYHHSFRGFWPLDVFRRLAPISYALYVLHLPLLLLVQHYFPSGSPLVEFVWVTPLVLLVAYLFEARLQPVFNRILKVGPPAPARGSGPEEPKPPDAKAPDANPPTGSAQALGS